MKELRIEYPEELGPVQIDLRVNVGQRVKAGDFIALVETEKASQELEAFEPFILLRIEPHGAWLHPPN